MVTSCLAWDAVRHAVSQKMPSICCMTQSTAFKQKRNCVYLNCMMISICSSPKRISSIAVDQVKQATPDHIDDMISSPDQLGIEVSHGGNHRVHQAMEEAWGRL